jgi:hypothetical protein
MASLLLMAQSSTSLPEALLLVIEKVTFHLPKLIYSTVLLFIYTSCCTLFGRSTISYSSSSSYGAVLVAMNVGSASIAVHKDNVAPNMHYVIPLSSPVQCYSSTCAGKHFPWVPQALGELGSGPPDSLGYSINDAPALCVFTESCDDAEQSEAHTVLAAAAEAAAAALKASGSTAPPPLLYFHASAGGGLADRVRELCGLGSAQEAAGPAMVILDVAQVCVCGNLHAVQFGRVLLVAVTVCGCIVCAMVCACAYASSAVCHKDNMNV